MILPMEERFAPPATKADSAYQTIRSQLLAGRFQAGSVLDQGALAKALGMSTTPVREALRRLETEELVVMSAHKDVRVAPLSRETLLDLYEVRLTLDPLAASLTAERASDADLDAIAKTIKGRRRSATAGAAANLDFHRALYHACQNPVLIALLDSLWTRTERYRMELVNTNRYMHVHEEEHEEILGALRARDPLRTAHLVREHTVKAMSQIDVVSDGETSRAAL